MSKVKIGVWLPDKVDVDRFDNVDSLEAFCALLHDYPAGTFLRIYLNKEVDKVAFEPLTEITIGDHTIRKIENELATVAQREAAKYLTEEQVAEVNMKVQEAVDSWNDTRSS